MSRGQRWEGHPWAARLVKTVAFLGPVVVAVLTTIWISRQLPEPQSFGAAVGAWLVLGVVATVIVLVLDRVARRLLPFAALLKLSLAFPGSVPSRYKIARARGGSRELQKEVEAAREHGLSSDRTEAATSVLRLVAALSTHDRATRGHAERVRVFVDMIAEELDLSDEDTDKLRWAALLHDVGKIAVHPDVLNDPGRPSEEAWELLRSHPLEGARITAPLRPWLGHWALAIEQHHERWDGEGYPYGLAGEELSLGARIVAVADAYDVMTAARAYKQPMPAAEAREELATHASTQFDPAIVRAFLSIPLNRLRWAVGPFSWIASTPFGRPFEALSGGAGAAAAAVAATVAGAIGLGLPVSAPAELPEIDEVTEEPVAEPTPEPTQSPAPSPSPVLLLGEEVLAEGRGPVAVDVFENDRTDNPELMLVDVSADVGEVEWSEDGMLTWTPPPDFVGVATITYTATDGVSTATGVLLVEVVNQAPTLVDDAATVGEDTSTRIDLLANDSDPEGDALTLVGVRGARLGTVVDNGDGSITYTPRPGLSGVDTLTYTATDGLLEETAQVAVTIVPADDAPVLQADTLTLDEDATAVVDVLANDIDPDGDALTVVAVDVPGATTSIEGGGVRVTPDANTNGTLTGTVSVSDGTTTVQSPLEVRVLPVNDAPRITPGSAITVTSDAGAVTRSGWASGISPGPADEAGQRLVITTATSNPGLFSSGPRLTTDGDLSFAVAPGATGTATVTFVVRDSGGTQRGGDDTTTVTTTITVQSTAPTATDDAASTTVDQAIIIDVLANDSDPRGRTLTVVSFDESATRGSLVDLGDGRFRYEPPPGETGTDTFRYTVSNGSETDTATVSITIS